VTAVFGNCVFCTLQFPLPPLSTCPRSLLPSVSAISAANLVDGICCQRLPHLCCQLCLWSLCQLCPWFPLQIESMVPVLTVPTVSAAKCIQSLYCQLCAGSMLPSESTVHVVISVYILCCQLCLRLFSVIFCSDTGIVFQVFRSHITPTIRQVNKHHTQDCTSFVSV
jgi:hypothetical protein